MPNDSARRSALKDLPPILNATYERILRRVNTSNHYVQIHVSRTLRWIIHRDVDSETFTTKALCEAIPINVNDPERNTEMITDEFKILRWCSSLVRQSADGGQLELAHFTVKEFLLQIEDDDEGEFAIFRIGPGHDAIELAKVCLTFLRFQDFDVGSYASEEVTQRRFHDYPLREHAVNYWPKYAEQARGGLGDKKLASLIIKFFYPPKSNNLISWIQDLIPYRHSALKFEDRGTGAMETINSAIAEANVLHFAAMISFPWLCEWLIQKGCDVNRTSAFGTPLHCGLMLFQVLSASYLVDFDGDRAVSHEELVAEILLEAGANPNSCIRTQAGLLSPLFLSLSRCDLPSTLLLLDKGGRFDSRCMELLEDTLEDWNGRGVDLWDFEDISTILNHATSDNVNAECLPRLTRLAIKAGSLEQQTLLRKLDIEDYQLWKIALEESLRTAAEFGQLDVVEQLLAGKQLDIEAAEEDSPHRDLPRWWLSCRSFRWRHRSPLQLLPLGESRLKESLQSSEC